MWIRIFLHLYSIVHLTCGHHMNDFSTGTTHVVYRFIEGKFDFNTGQSICRQYGGHIIEINSWDKLTALRHLNDVEWNHQMQHDVWLGLTYTEENNYVWQSDCSILEFTNEFHALESYDTCSLTKRCLVRHHTGYWKGKECDHEQRLICETYEPDTPCPMSPELKTNVNMTENLQKESVCRSECESAPLCWSYIYLEDKVIKGQGNCLFFFDAISPDTPTVVHANFSKKICYRGEFVEEVDQQIVVNAIEDVQFHLPEFPFFNCTSLSSSVTSPTTADNFNTTVTLVNSFTATTYTLNGMQSASINVETTSIESSLHSSYHEPLCTCEPSVQMQYSSSSSSCAIQTVEVQPVCNVTKVWNSTSITHEEMSALLDNLAKNNSVPRKNTQAYRRSLMCASDSRQSAAAVGYVGVVLLAVPVCIIVVLDIPSLVVRIQTLRKFCRSPDKVTTL